VKLQEQHSEPAPQDMGYDQRNSAHRSSAQQIVSKQ